MMFVNSVPRMFGLIMTGIAHHAHHRRPSRAEETNYQNRRERQKDHVENDCVVPANGARRCPRTVCFSTLWRLEICSGDRAHISYVELRSGRSFCLVILLLLLMSNLSLSKQFKTLSIGFGRCRRRYSDQLGY